ncbi:MAG: hypothetical protein ACI3XQ_04020 [Eubacteriales bacterium]
MKKSLLKITAVLMVALIVCVALASCGKTLKGTYSAEKAQTGIELVFDGKDVKINVKALGATLASVDATYEIKGDKINISVGETDNEEAKALNGEFDFEQGDDYIKIATVKYTKKS